MSNRGGRSDRNARGGRAAPTELRASRRKAATRPFATGRVVIVGVIVALLVVALIVARTLRRVPSGGPSDTGPVSAALLQSLTSVPAEEFESIGQGTAAALPTPVRATVLRGSSGLPQLVYVGAEYCPYCAAERWGLVLALSRFGTFSGLQTSRSAADDVYPSTPTFTFAGSTYTSNYLEFSPVETLSNQKVNGAYAPIQTPTALQDQLLAQYDAPPYVSSDSAGSIPFLDIANQYIVVGASFNPSVLANQSWDGIATSLHQPDSDQAKAIVGTANVLTAGICSATNNAPANVCGQPAILSIEQAMTKTPVPVTKP
jgi:hypothetical protein